MYYLTQRWWDKFVHVFPKGMRLKVNVIARLEFELTTMSQSLRSGNFPQQVRINFNVMVTFNTLVNQIYQKCFRGNYINSATPINLSLSLSLSLSRLFPLSLLIGKIKFSLFLNVTFCCFFFSFLLTYSLSFPPFFCLLA